MLYTNLADPACSCWCWQTSQAGSRTQVWAPAPHSQFCRISLQKNCAISLRKQRGKTEKKALLWICFRIRLKKSFGSRSRPYLIRFFFFYLETLPYLWELCPSILCRIQIQIRIRNEGKKIRIRPHPDQRQWKRARKKLENCGKFSKASYAAANLKKWRENRSSLDVAGVSLAVGPGVLHRREQAIRMVKLSSL